MKRSLHLDAWPRASILVVGDVMLDRYLWGEVKRVSPEAPVPVVRVVERSEVLGGAGNVAANLAGLECQTTLIGTCGHDEAGGRVTALLREKNIESRLFFGDSFSTISKTRIIAHKQHVVRLDEESVQPLSEELQSRLLDLVGRILPRYHSVILSDYGKGLFQTPGIARGIISLCRDRGTPVLIDPKGSDWKRYEGATCVTPNTSELEMVTGSTLGEDEAQLAASAQTLRHQYGLGAVLVTRGPKGMCFVDAGKTPFMISARAQDVYDVSGAGDTVIATLGAGVGCGLTLRQAAVIANEAAGVVVTKLGTQPIVREALNAALRINGGNHKNPRSRKVASPDAARLQVQAWRAAGQSIVFTNGCFDLLHPGHVHLLHQARELGDRLVVGLNSDTSVKRLKGPARPILNEQDRSELLAALTSVDLIVLFEENTPLSLIKSLRPDLLVKGSDYRLDTVVGREIVESYGGTVQLVPLMQGPSTTGIISRIALQGSGGVARQAAKAKSPLRETG